MVSIVCGTAAMAVSVLLPAVERVATKPRPGESALSPCPCTATVGSCSAPASPPMAAPGAAAEAPVEAPGAELSGGGAVGVSPASCARAAVAPAPIASTGSSQRAARGAGQGTVRGSGRRGEGDRGTAGSTLMRMRVTLSRGGF